MKPFRQRAAAVLVPIAFATYLSACEDLQKKTSFTSTPLPQVDQKAESGRAAVKAMQAREDQAITLAKEGRNLVAGQVYAARPEPATLTNDYQLRLQMSRVKGDIHVIGWKATLFEGDTYLVAYTFERADGKIRGWPFEVQLSAGVVRYVIGDLELEQKYGWNQ